MAEPQRPAMLSLTEVLSRALAVARDRVIADTEKLDTFDALGRVLARGVVSALDVPPADNSAMDGYAMRVADLPAAKKPFLEFETLTLAPFDRRLIEGAMLSAEERRWIDAYHARVLAEVGPGLDTTERDWLAAACAALG